MRYAALLFVCLSGCVQTPSMALKKYDPELFGVGEDAGVGCAGEPSGAGRGL